MNWEKIMWFFAIIGMVFTVYLIAVFLYEYIVNYDFLKSEGHTRIEMCLIGYTQGWNSCLDCDGFWNGGIIPIAWTRGFGNHGLQ